MNILLGPAIALFTLSAPAQGTDFTRDVKPILARHCVECHGAKKQRGSLRVDTARAIRAGGSSGAAVIPGKSASSALIVAITGGKGDIKAMPPKGPKLSIKEVATLKKWIDEGAKVPASEITTLTKSDHWSFQPVKRPAIPTAKSMIWVRNPIDSFILARLQKQNIKPSSEADRVTLLRRLHLDLIGIPPTPTEVKAYLADNRPGAYERVVDRLLASPHFGERWGRHWLDGARYADSNGYSIDSPRAIWKYRDWIINAINTDKPFDRFTIEQLAGDLLPRATLEQKIATGFHRNTQINEEGGIDREQFRIEAIVDRTNTTGSVWLALTVGCCQCHDHKYDPLSQKDYYRFFAFFNSSDEPKLPLLSDTVLKQRKAILADVQRMETQLKAIDGITSKKIEVWEGSLTPAQRMMLPKQIQNIIAIAPNGRSPRQEQLLIDSYRKVDQVRHVVGMLTTPMMAAAQLHLLTRRIVIQKQIAGRKKQTPAQLTTMILSERRMPRMTNVLLAGDFLRKGALVGPGTPAVLPKMPGKKSPTRLDLANWLIDGKNPLTGRVLVNRLWQQYFGQGLVETDSDFGTQGTKPSHPDLLDWLADEVVRRQWSMKEMHRLIVTSATYRQSSDARPDLKVTDPRNLLLARQNRLRLEAEIVRDVTLVASGLFTATIGGPSVFPPQPQGVYSFTQVPKNWIASTGPARFRRGMYTHFWRSAPHPGLTIFDAPDALATCTRRNRSNTPLQALTLLNDQGFVECAQALARRILTEEKKEGNRLSYAFRLTLGRTATAQERTILTRLFTAQQQALARDTKEAKSLAGQPLPGVDLSTQAAWVQVSRVLLNLDEFITRE